MCRTPSTNKAPKLPLQFLIAITVRHKQHVIHQYAGMHQADNYSFAEYMVTEAKKVSGWSTRKKIELTRCGGTATVSCDYKGAKPVSTQDDDPDDYKSAEGIAVALATEGKKGVRLTIDIMYDLEQVVDEDSAHSEVEQPQPKKARKVCQLKLTSMLIAVTE